MTKLGELAEGQPQRVLGIIEDYLDRHAVFNPPAGTYPACGSDLVDYAKWHADPANNNHPWPGVRGDQILGDDDD